MTGSMLSAILDRPHVHVLVGVIIALGLGLPGDRTTGDVFGLSGFSFLRGGQGSARQNQKEGYRYRE